jgi:DNA sulfur modification protein DndE
VHDCHYDGLSAGIRFKAARGRGGVVENIFVENITMGRIPGDAIQLTSEYSSFVRADGQAPVFRNITIRNVTCDRARTAAQILGLADSAIQKLLLQNVRIVADEGLYCFAGNGIKLVDVQIAPTSGPVFAMKDTQHVVIDGLHQSESSNVFLDLRGRQTREIRLCGKSNGTRPAVVLGIDVPHDAIVHE